MYNDSKKEKMELFYSELVRVNEFINLTSITNREEVEVKHFRDSLSAVEFIKKIAENSWNCKDNEPLRLRHKSNWSPLVADIGTGAGFPSIPLAIMLPDVSFTLIETVGKKVNFLLDIKDKLELRNVEVIKSRVEELPKEKMYDICVTRAVASMPTLLEYSLPFVKLNGHLIMYKGSNYIEELNISKNALTELGGKVETIEKYNLEFNGEILERALLVVKKIAETPSKYPRDKNKPRLKPLL